MTTRKQPPVKRVLGRTVLDTSAPATEPAADTAPDTPDAPPAFRASATPPARRR